MCRFVFYRGRPLRVSALLTEPSHSLIHQSFHSEEREEPLNGDGFGLAWYVDGIEEPGLFRSLTPAWSNSNLRELARVTTSTCIMAHVRAASRQLEVSEVSCHPFKFGPWSFMHNGEIGGFSRIRRPLLDSLGDTAFHAIRGGTDSEHLFALFIDELIAAGSPTTGVAAANALESAVRRVVELVRRHTPQEPSYLNIAVSNGNIAVACRLTTDSPEFADSLYISQGRRYVCEGNVCRMVEADDFGGAVLISSERLSDDGVWQTIAVGDMVIVSADLGVEQRNAVLT
jgi:glutamine amidotransferase